MSAADAAELTKTIRDAVRKYETDGPVQWYVDELCIDCDAETFWRVVEQALASAL